MDTEETIQVQNHKRMVKGVYDDGEKEKEATIEETIEEEEEEEEVMRGVSWKFRTAVFLKVMEFWRIWRYPLLETKEDWDEQLKHEAKFNMFETETAEDATCQLDYAFKLFIKHLTLDRTSEVSGMYQRLISNIVSNIDGINRRRSNLESNLGAQQASSIPTEMGWDTVAVSLNNIPSTGILNDSNKQVNGIQTSALKSTRTSTISKCISEANHVLLEQIRDINQHLRSMVVEITDEYIDPSVIPRRIKRSEAITVKCSYKSMAHIFLKHSPNQFSDFSLWLVVTPDYPSASPLAFLYFPAEYCKDCENICRKAWSWCDRALQELPHPVSLPDIASYWEQCGIVATSDLIMVIRKEEGPGRLRKFNSYLRRLRSANPET